MVKATLVITVRFREWLLINRKEVIITLDRFKFRVYCIPEDCYVKITQLDFDENGNVLKMKFIKPKSIDPDGFEYICDYDQLSDFVFEHCTGARDKNGKLIFENDIVKALSRNVLVEYGKDNTISVAGFWPIDNWVEVVGNIHENIDLLRKEEQK